MDYYAVLGVPADAGRDTIRRAYRKLVRRYHPDAGAGSSPEKFRQIVEAYATLSDPVRRGSYDRARMAARPVRRPVPAEPMVRGQRLRPEPLAQQELAEWLAEMRRWLNTDPFTGGRFRW